MYVCGFAKGVGVYQQKLMLFGVGILGLGSPCSNASVHVEYCCDGDTADPVLWYQETTHRLHMWGKQKTF